MPSVEFHKLFFSAIIVCILSSCNSITTKNQYDSAQVDLLLEQQQKADAAYSSDDCESAIKHYEILVETYPSNDMAWFRLGNCYSQIGQNEQSLTAYSKAIEIDPNNSKAWHNKGTLQLRMATETFLNMQEYSSDDDVYAKRGRYVIQSIEEILQKGFGVPINNE